MVKRKKSNRGSGSNAAKDNAGDENGEASKVKAGTFCLKSSLGVPFLVISDGNLVSGIPKPSPDELKELLEICRNVFKQWDTKGGSVILADFEGEHTGLEGELITAAFQRTWAVSPKGLKQMPCKGPSRDMGLLVDLRSADGVALVKRIMESDCCSKAIWGADGDVASLRFSPMRSPLGIHSSQVLDAQLAFSSSKQRLSMSDMLKRLPAESIARLPDKGSIDFTTSHAFNRRALHTPLSLQEATYAIDDLHRLDSVLINQKPPGGSYVSAQSQTMAITSLILNNTAGASTTRLQHYEGMMKRKLGSERQSIAVRIKRHLIALRGHGLETCAKEFSVLEEEVDNILHDAGVSIPGDLSFSSNLGENSETTNAGSQAKKRRKKKAKNLVVSLQDEQKEVTKDPCVELAVKKKKRLKRKRQNGERDAHTTLENKSSKRRKEASLRDGESIS